MPAYKLTYYNIPGLGEPIRLLLSYMGVDFEDNRISFKDWPALKPKMPLGQMPVLEIDDKILTQSVAICRYLGNEAKLSGANSWENVLIDIAVDTIRDFHLNIERVVSEENAELKEKKKEVLLKETTPFYLSKLDEQVKANNGYLANGKLSWADLYWVGFCDTAQALLKDNYVERYANLKKNREIVLALPKIKAWMKKRPEGEPMTFSL